MLATTETDGRGGTNVLGGDENLHAAGAHAAAANLETDRGGVIHRFPLLGGRPAPASPSWPSELSTGRQLPAAAFDDAGAWIDYAGPRGTIPTYHFSRPRRRAASTPTRCAAASS